MVLSGRAETTYNEACGGAIDLGGLPGLLGYALRRAQLAVFKDFHTSCEALAIRPAQYSVLTVLRRNPGLRQSQVAEALGIKRANFVVLLDGLEARGLTRRDRAPDDQRAVALHLTESGVRLLDAVDHLVAQHDQRFVARVGAQNRAVLLDWLNRIARDDTNQPGD